MSSSSGLRQLFADFVGFGWRHLPGLFCPVDQRISEHPTRRAAQLACSNDTACHAVFDWGCDAVGLWRTCRTSVGAVSSESCMYTPAPSGGCAAAGLEAVANSSGMAGSDECACCEESLRVRDACGTCVRNGSQTTADCTAGLHPGEPRLAL